MKGKKTISVFIAVIMIIMPFFAIITSASVVDLERSVSFMITDIPFADIEFYAYFIAEFDGYGNLTVDEKYNKADVELSSGEYSSYYELADTLSKYVLSENISYDAVAISDSDGNAEFDSASLKHGLYLITGEKYVKDGCSYVASPFMVALPLIQGEKINYDVVADAKFDVLPAVDVYTVCKIWKDDGATDRRPPEIYVELYCDGEVYDEITLPYNGHWEYEWKDLPSDHTWWVEEKEVTDYESEVVQKGTSFVITNTYNGEIPPSEGDIPSTGQLWWPVPVLFCIGLLFIVLGLVRRKKAE